MLCFAGSGALMVQAEFHKAAMPEHHQEAKPPGEAAVSNAAQQRIDPQKGPHQDNLPF